MHVPTLTAPLLGTDWTLLPDQRSTPPSPLTREAPATAEVTRPAAAAGLTAVAQPAVMGAPPLASMVRPQPPSPTPTPPRPSVPEARPFVRAAAEKVWQTLREWPRRTFADDCCGSSPLYATCALPLAAIPGEVMACKVGCCGGAGTLCFASHTAACWAAAGTAVGGSALACLLPIAGIQTYALAAGHLRARQRAQQEVARWQAQCEVLAARDAAARTDYEARVAAHVRAQVQAVLQELDAAARCATPAATPVPPVNDPRHEPSPLLAAAVAGDVERAHRLAGRPDPQDGAHLAAALLAGELPAVSIAWLSRVRDATVASALGRALWAQALVRAVQRNALPEVRALVAAVRHLAAVLPPAEAAPMASPLAVAVACGHWRAGTIIVEGGLSVAPVWGSAEVAAAMPSWPELTRPDGSPDVPTPNLDAVAFWQALFARRARLDVAELRAAVARGCVDYVTAAQCGRRVPLPRGPYTNLLDAAPTPAMRAALTVGMAPVEQLPEHSPRAACHGGELDLLRPAV